MRLFTIVNKLLLCSLSCCLLLTLNSQAQETGKKKITGKIISSADDKPLPNASISISGSAAITISDHNGQFTIEAGTGDKLVISIIGYQQKEVRVGKGNTLEIKMEQTAIKLDDVVVIGYGKTKRKDVTGAISSISGEELRKTPAATFDQALQGKVAGLVVQQVSGQPGGGVSVQIRGVSSISGNNAPLYVIDGVIIPSPGDPGSGSNPLNTINPNEIESIDVLKDASATAIYGSQATNGVIIITTKRGRVGAPTISYDGYYGYQELPKRLPVVDLQEFATVLNARATVWGFDARPEFVNPKYVGKGTDWQSELFRKAPMQNHAVTINGGDARTQYLLSASYFDQEGIALGSDFKRYSVRLNLDNKTTNWLKIGTSLQLSHVDENVNSTSSSVINNALVLTPDIPVKNLDGTWGGITNTSGWVTAVPNPVGLARLNSRTKNRNQVFGNAYAEIQFYKDLSLRNEMSGNFDFNTEESFNPTYNFGKVINNTNSGSSSSGQNIYTVVRNFLTYSHSLEKLNVNVLAGHEAQLSTFKNVSAARQNFPSNSVQAVSSGDANTATNGGGKGSGPALESWFGRVNLGWSDRYLLTGNIRRDGSSNFAPGKQWVNTYSGALAWKINNEEFLKDVRFINELKLRVGYGSTNNQGIPGNTFVTLLTSVNNGLSGSAQFQSNLANPLVSWEKTKYSNVGIDGSFLNGRLSFSFDLYNRQTDGLLLKLPLPLFSGTATDWSPGAMQAPYVNVGAVSNKGFDFKISTTNIVTKNSTWKTDFTVSHNVNKILSLGAGGDAANLSQKYRGYVFGKTVVGQSIGGFYGYLFDGVFANVEDFTGHALPVNQSGVPYPISPDGGGIWYGDRKYKDLNGDGVIDTKDQTFLGSPIPKFQFGFNNSVTYKNFDLNVFFSASLGNKVLNQLLITQTNPQNNTSYFRSVLDFAQVAYIDPKESTSNIYNAYVKNPNTKIPGLRNDNTNENDRPSDLFIEDGSFIKCKNISLGYRVPEALVKKAHVHALRFYVTVSNAFMITKYSGMDPEIGSWNPLQAGWDNGYYPQSRTFTIGANLNLTR
ncbi:SusC/RagA family TonB-linked outer membrane protein [Niastella sp. OAS944]|uniref:SusC/RagA family TonB-linked outer membrane protein n=1 Tax=Niastella sp. OAS944 TaxID=2664089 RepID=UPI003480A49E|nr:TonB-linked SusC/RagA family outer membrane protein [Chitinophagaceae bacterium OAS944]